MIALKENFTLSMSPDERDALLADVWRVHGHLESYFQQCGDVEQGTDDEKLADSMSALERLAQTIQNARYS